MWNNLQVMWNMFDTKYKVFKKNIPQHENITCSEALLMWNFKDKWLIQDLHTMYVLKMTD